MLATAMYSLCILIGISYVGYGTLGLLDHSKAPPEREVRHIQERQIEVQGPIGPQQK